MKALAILTTIVLGSLALLHVYWGFGGQWGLASAIPTVAGRPVFQPSGLASFVVATALAAAAALTFAATGAFRAFVPGWFVRTGLIVLTLVFTARCVGDLHLFGFAKTVTDTDFARMDTLVFSPLCALLAVACGFLASRGARSLTK